MEAARQAQTDAGLEAGFGLQVEFESFPDIGLAFESLARERSGIELFNVRHEGTVTKATVFVPDGKLSLFEQWIRDYLANKKSEDGKRSLDHKALINTIREIRAATLKELWTDSPFVFPETKTKCFGGKFGCQFAEIDRRLWPTFAGLLKCIISWWLPKNSNFLSAPFY